MARSKVVKYEVKKGMGYGKERGLTCAVYVGDSLVAQVEDSVSEDEV